MIDQARLRALSLENLTALRASINEAIDAKMRRELRVGSEVLFKSSRTGLMTRLYITGRGPKNLMGYEIDAEGRHQPLKRWRVSPNFVTVVPPRDRPTTVAGAF